MSHENTTVTKEWTRLLGSTSHDVAFSIKTDSEGSIYIAGYTEGNLDDQSNSGGRDAFLSKYNSSGSKIWTRQLGTPGEDIAYSVDISPDGSIFIAGETQGNLDSNTNSGGKQAFLSKYDSNGSKIWTKQAEQSIAYSLSVGADESIYIAGNTWGDLDGNINSGSDDGFLRKYKSDGTSVWTKLIGESAADIARSVTNGSDGSIYVVGETYSNLDGQINSGAGDAFISRYSEDGVRLWTRLLGSPSNDTADAITINSDGSIYIAGYTRGDLAGQTNSGQNDAFLSKSVKTDQCF